MGNTTQQISMRGNRNPLRIRIDQGPLIPGDYQACQFVGYAPQEGDFLSRSPFCGWKYDGNKVSVTSATLAAYGPNFQELLATLRDRLNGTEVNTQQAVAFVRETFTYVDSEYGRLGFTDTERLIASKEGNCLDLSLISAMLANSDNVERSYIRVGYAGNKLDKLESGEEGTAVIVDLSLRRGWIAHAWVREADGDVMYDPTFRTIATERPVEVDEIISGATQFSCSASRFFDFQRIYLNLTDKILSGPGNVDNLFLETHLQVLRRI